MNTVLNINVDELDHAFVDNLKRDFAHASVEIHVQDAVDSAETFGVSDFWAAMDRLDWQHEGDDDMVVAPLIAFLGAGPLAHIYRFHDLLAEQLWKLDTYPHAKVFLDDPEEDGFLSVDDFLYTRCAVVANGQAYYEKVIANPALMPPDLTFEPLLYVALKAYKLQTGKNFAAVAPFNYETYSNQGGWADKR